MSVSEAVAMRRELLGPQHGYAVMAWRGGPAAATEAPVPAVHSATDRDTAARTRERFMTRGMRQPAQKYRLRPSDSRGDLLELARPVW